MVCRIFIVESRLEREATGWHIGNDPFTIPLGIARSSYRGCPKPHGWVMFVSCGKVGIQCCEDIRIRRQSVYICHWEFESAVKDEFDIEAWRRSWNRCVVESTSRFTIIFLAFAMFGGFAVELLRFLVEFGGVAHAVMTIRLLGDLFVVHSNWEQW